ncbi:MAG: class I SAM-dependent methyltransferase [Flavobacteriaceae bacterium]
MSGEHYKTQKSVNEYIHLAKGFNGSELIDKLKNVLQQHSIVLEIGSGPGTDWSILNRFYKVVGSDFSLEFLNHLRYKYPTGEFLNLDAVTLKTEQKFDGIYSNKVLHHLKDKELIESIKNQHKTLNDGGIICHSFWKGEDSEIFKGLFVNYHDKSSLRKFYEAGFDILTLDTYKEFEDGDSLLLIGKKK